MCADIKRKQKKQLSLSVCDLREVGVAADFQKQMCTVRGCCLEALLGRWIHHTTKGEAVTQLWPE